MDVSNMGLSIIGVKKQINIQWLNWGLKFI